MRRSLAVTLSAIALLPAASRAQTAGPSQGPSPAALIYPQTNAAKDIDAALAAAAKDGKHVLLDFGADWCPDCRVLARLFEDPAVAPFAQASFHVVHVDVGFRNKNGDLAGKFGATSGDWIPAIVVLDGQRNRIAATDDKVRVTRSTTAAELLALLQKWAPKRTVRELSSFTERGVHVRISLQQDAARQTWLTATFTPADPDMHLYSLDLPEDGIDGLGRPTRLQVTASTGLTVTGDPVADRPVQHERIASLNTTLAVYPAGPVSLRLPIALTSYGAVVSADLSLSYMACGPKGCLPPVLGKKIAIRLDR